MTTKNKIRIGSRGSDLALAQAYYIQDRIGALENAPETELIIIKTSGDQIQDVPLSSVGTSPDDRKGFFTKEIEDAMLAGEIDLAVHSFKDMPTQDVPGLKILSMPQRLQPLDFILLPRSKKVMDHPPYLATGSVIGTSSIRRESQIALQWPGITTAMLRGNVPTRIRKLLDGNYDAILLSGAGFNRLMEGGTFAKSDLESRIKSELEVIPLQPEEFVPAPAQGALALQCRENDGFTKDILARLHDETAGKPVTVERDVLRSLEGGCHLPLGAHCHQGDDGYIFHLFLGKEAVDNRKGKSYIRKRFAPTTEILSRFAVAEVKEQLPVVLTGREDRIKELVSERPDAPIVPFPLLRTETIEVDRSELEGFVNQIQESKKPVLSVFSASGVKSLRSLLEKYELSLPENIVWAVPGDKTAQAIQETFPKAKIGFTSPDNTGETLAKVLSSDPAFGEMTFLAAAAKEGRDEFYDILKKAGKDVFRLFVYRTNPIRHSGADFASLPARAYVLLGSPSAAQAYFEARNQTEGPLLEERRDGHRICAIGPTTRSAVEKEGGFVYAMAVSADYGSFIDEF